MILDTHQTVKNASKKYNIVKVLDKKNEKRKKTNINKLF